METKLDRLPEKGPAVYGFYLDVRPPKRADNPQFVQALRDLCALPHGPTRKATLWPYETLTVEHRTAVELSYVAWDASTERLFSRPGFADEVCAVLSAIQEIIPPLYVGESHRLRGRIRDHLSEGSDLLPRLEACGLRIDQLVLRYLLLEGVAPDERVEELVEEPADDEYSVYLSGESAHPVDVSRRDRLFIEELITRLCKPRFVNKVGNKTGS
jgi:hypothetical protein